jgi:transposase-like protein
MKTNLYCPHCQSFSIKRKHRSFLAKHILHLPKQYQCNDCGKKFSFDSFTLNKPKDLEAK